MVKSIKRGFLGVMLTLALLCSVTLTAFATSVSVKASPDTLTEPGAVDVTVEVRNTSDLPMIDVEVVSDGVSQYLGDIPPGDRVTTTVSGYQVSQQQLDDGFGWEVQWWTEEGELQINAVSIPVAKKVGKPGMSLSVKADKEQYRSGEEAKLTYRVTNTGEVDLVGIVIQDELAEEPIARGISLKPGESESKTHTLTIDKNVASMARAAGESAAGEDVSAKADGLALEVMETGLNILLSEVERGAGMTSVDILLINNGNVDFNNIVLSDDAGAIIAEGLTLKEGEEAHIDYEVPTEGERQLVVNASYQAGEMEESLSAASTPLTLAPLYMPEDLQLGAQLRVDKTALEEAGPVALQLTLQNDTPIELQNVILKDEQGNALLTIPVLGQGTSEQSASINVSESRDLRLYVEYQDSEGRYYREDLNAVHIEVKAAEAVTSPVPLPEVGDNNIEMIILMVVLAAILLAVVIAIIALLIKRARLAQGEGDDREMLEEMAWASQAPRRAVPREAVQELPPENEDAIPPLRPVPRPKPVTDVEAPQQEAVRPRTLHPKRNQTPPMPTPPVSQPSAAAERARRESAQAQQRAQRETNDRQQSQPRPPARPVTQAPKTTAAPAQKPMPKTPPAQSNRMNANADGRMARKQQDGARHAVPKRPATSVESASQRRPTQQRMPDGLPKVPNYVIDEEAVPRSTRSGATYVPQQREGAGPRRARPVEEQLAQEPLAQEPLAQEPRVQGSLTQEPRTQGDQRSVNPAVDVDDQYDWELFEEAFGEGDEKPPAELDDWALFEESFLDDDPQKR